MKNPNCRVFGKFVRCHRALIFPWLPASTQLYSAINHTELLKPVKNVQKPIHLSSPPSVSQKHINYKAWVNTVHHIFHCVLQGTTVWKWQHGVFGGCFLKRSCKFSWRCTANGSRTVLLWRGSSFWTSLAWQSTPPKHLDDIPSLLHCLTTLSHVTAGMN